MRAFPRKKSFKNSPVEAIVQIPVSQESGVKGKRIVGKIAFSHPALHDYTPNRPNLMIAMI